MLLSFLLLHTGTLFFLPPLVTDGRNMHHASAHFTAATTNNENWSALVRTTSVRTYCTFYSKHTTLDVIRSSRPLRATRRGIPGESSRNGIGSCRASRIRRPSFQRIPPPLIIRCGGTTPGRTPFGPVRVITTTDDAVRTALLHRPRRDKSCRGGGPRCRLKGGQRTLALYTEGRLNPHTCPLEVDPRVVYSYVYPAYCTNYEYRSIKSTYELYEHIQNSNVKPDKFDKPTAIIYTAKIQAFHSNRYKKSVSIFFPQFSTFFSLSNVDENDYGDGDARTNKNSRTTAAHIRRFVRIQN